MADINREVTAQMSIERYEELIAIEKEVTNNREQKLLDNLQEFQSYCDSIEKQHTKMYLTDIIDMLDNKNKSNFVLSLSAAAVHSIIQVERKPKL